VRSAVFSADGQWVVTASYDHTARVWNAATGLPASPPMRHSSAIYIAHFDPKNPQLVVTASLDGTARIWRWHEVKPLPVITGAGVLQQVCWDRDASRILTVSDTGTQAWDGRTGHPVAGILFPGATGAIAACSSDGQWMVTASGKSAQLRSAITGQTIAAPISLADAPINPETGSGLRFDPQNRRFATISDQGVWLWDAKTGRSVLRNPIRMDGIVGAAFSRDGNMIATYSKSGAVRVWSVPGGTPVGQVMKHDGKVTSADFSPDGKLLVTASADHTAQVWNAQTFKAAGQPMRQKASIVHAGFSPDGRWVLTLSGDGMAQVWDAHTGIPVSAPFHSPQPGATQLAGAGFSADGNWIVAFGNTVSGDKGPPYWTVQVREAPITGTIAPQWLIALAEGIGGLKVGSGEALEPTPESEDPVLLREQLARLPGSDPVSRFGRWLASDPATRPISPKDER
jgi:WD40 repeat protein